MVVHSFNLSTEEADEFKAGLVYRASCRPVRAKKEQLLSCQEHLLFLQRFSSQHPHLTVAPAPRDLMPCSGFLGTPTHTAQAHTHKVTLIRKKVSTKPKRCSARRNTLLPFLEIRRINKGSWIERKPFQVFLCLHPAFCPAAYSCRTEGSQWLSRPPQRR